MSNKNAISEKLRKMASDISSKLLIAADAHEILQARNRELRSAIIDAMVVLNDDGTDNKITQADDILGDVLQGNDHE